VIFCKYGISSQNDYHSKYRLEILCQEPVWMLLYLFPRPGILVNSWKYRTLDKLVWMSTWRIKAAKCELLKLILSLGPVRNCAMRIVYPSRRVVGEEQNEQSGGRIVYVKHTRGLHTHTIGRPIKQITKSSTASSKDSTLAMAQNVCEADVVPATTPFKGL